MTDENHTKFSPFVAGAFTLNYIIGSGFLLLPWAFSKAGLVLSVFVLALVGAFSVLAVYFIINAMYRAVILSDDFQNDEIFHYSMKNDKKIINKIKQSRERYEIEDLFYNLPILKQQQQQQHVSRVRQLYDYKSLHPSSANSDNTDSIHINYVTSSSTSSSSSSPPNSGNNNNNININTNTKESKENELDTSNSSRRSLLRSSSSSSSSLSYVLLKDDNNIIQSTVNTNDMNKDDDDNGKGVRFHLYELTDLCLIFLGKRGKICYGITLCLYMYGALWAYSSVFAHALSSVPFFHIYHSNDSNNSDEEEDIRINYMIYLFFFSLLVVPLSCMDLSEQAVVQVVMAGCRFIMLFLMLATIGYSSLFDVQSFSDFLPNESASSVAADGNGGANRNIMTTISNGIFTTTSNNNNNMNNNIHTFHTSGVEVGGTITWFDFSNLYLLLPVAAYANVFHHSVPALADNLENKKYLIPVFAGTLLICFLFYSLIGVVVSTYFQDHVRPASNLNWVTYIGFLSASDHFRVPLWAKSISMFIVLFPALDVTSAFPLNAITLGNNILTFLYDSNDDDDYDNENSDDSDIRNNNNYNNNNNTNSSNNDIYEDKNIPYNDDDTNRRVPSTTSRDIINSRASMSSSNNTTTTSISMNKSRDDDTNHIIRKSNSSNHNHNNTGHGGSSSTGASGGSGGSASSVTDVELIHKDGYHYYHNLNVIDDNLLQNTNTRNHHHHSNSNSNNHGNERGHYDNFRSSNNSHNRGINNSSNSSNSNNNNNNNSNNTININNNIPNTSPPTPTTTTTNATINHNRKWWIRKLFRLIAAVPPIIGAAYISDLGKITDYTGITGFAIAFIFPGLIAIFSQKMCINKHLSLSTPYVRHSGSYFITRATTGSFAQYGCVVLGIFLSVFVLINLLLH